MAQSVSDLLMTFVFHCSSNIADDGLWCQVGCRDGPRSELDETLRQAGPPPEGVSAVWMMAADEVLCAHCHLLVDLSTKLRDFLEQCAPSWESEIESERRRVNGEQNSRSILPILHESLVNYSITFI